MTKAQWQQSLEQNGFSGIDIILDDHKDSVSMASVIVATAVEPKNQRPISPMPKARIVFVLTGHPCTNKTNFLIRCIPTF